jgi:hypothetical protein
MNKILLIAIAALGFYIWTTRPIGVAAADLVSSANLVSSSSKPTPSPTPVQFERRTQIVVVPAVDGSLANRWKTGPNAQTDLTDGRSW